MAHHPPPPGLSPRFRHLRTLSGLSLRETSALLEGAVTLARSIEHNDQANPTASVLARVAERLGATLDWLVRGEGEPPTREQVLSAVERARASKEAAQMAPLRPCQIALLRSAASIHGAYLGFPGNHLPGRKAIAAELARLGLVELVAPDLARITPAGREQLREEVRRAAE